MSDRSSTPRGTYLQVANTIRETIERGHYTDRLPTMRELGITHVVSRSVIHRALHLLKDQGIVEPVAGLAWYVANTGDRRPIDLRTREMIRHDYEPGDRLPGEITLAARLGVSRVSMRSALAHLEGQCIISEATPRGRIVLAISTDKEAS